MSLCLHSKPSSLACVLHDCSKFIAIWFVMPSTEHLSAHRRSCLGQKYALSVGALVIGHILQQYDVILSGGAERDIAMKCQNLSLEARHGIHLTFQPRHKGVQT